MRHVRAVHDGIGAPAWLVANVALRELPAYARTRVSAHARTVPLEWQPELDALLGSAPRCKACTTGAPCAQWNWEELAQACVTPRAPDDTEMRDDEPTNDLARTRAAAALGLTTETMDDPDAVRAAHRRLALQCHPDRGGDTDTMAALNAARDVLLARL